MRDANDYFILVNREGETDIAVPDEFYQIIICRDKATEKYITAAFLFPHLDDPEELPSDDVLYYLVSVDEIERKTGLDFLNRLSAAEQEEIEGSSNRAFWEPLIGN